MATNPLKSRTVIGRVGLLGATAGTVLGLIEAAGMRLTDLPILKPHVPISFWFFAPLAMSVTFGLMGLLAGFLATLPKSKFWGMFIIACSAGLAGFYLGLVLQFSKAGIGWYLALRSLLSPYILFGVAFGWTLAALWATRTAGSPLGFLANVPGRFWTRAVLGTMATLAFSAAIFHFPEHFNLSTAHATTGKPQSPNIVLIVLDTVRADHVSSYGYFRNTTPNLDQVAKRGVLFENAYSASSWTLPSTLSMFTSLLPHQHGAGTDRAGEPRTLAEILSAGGYETAGFNANPYYGIVPWGLGRGYGSYTDSTGTMGYSLDAMRLGRDFIEPVSEELFQRSRLNQFTAHQLNEQVYRWYDHRPERPFFLFLNYNDAHDPYEAPAPFDHFFGHDSRDAKHLLLTAKLNRVALPSADRDGVIASYDNCLHYIDSQVAELLSFLQSSPEWANTYVIITADHGEGFGEHGTYSHGSNLYRELLHVPLIVVGPGVPAGLRVSDTASTRRIFSTVLEFAGVKGAVLHRSSLSRLWTPGYAPNNPEEPTVSELFDSSPSLGPHGLITITTREWQLIHKSGVHRNELYHWTADPSEQNNVADLADNQAVVQHLEQTLYSIVERSRRPWRDTSYLLALAGPDFSPDLLAMKPNPKLPDGSLLPTGAGAAQTLFAPNADPPKSSAKDLEKESLKTLPYDEP